MADAVVTRVTQNGPLHFTVELSGISDGTGETNVVKVDKSTLVNGWGVEPTQLKFRDAQWSIQGFSSVRLLWDHAVDDVMLVMAAGNGYASAESTRPDPTPGNGLGDVLLTSVGAINGATYEITLRLIKSQNG